MPENRVNATLSPEDKAEIIAALRLVKQKLPFLVGLSPAQRRDLSKAGRLRYSFVQKTLILAEQNPQILPQAFNVEDFRRDVELLDALRSVFGEVVDLHELLGDTLIALSHETYRAARTVYHLAKADSGHGLDGLVRELGDVYPQRGKRRAKKDQSAADSPENLA